MDLNFNANDHEPLADFDTLPKGWYPVVITKTEGKDAKTGNGSYMQVEFTVIDGAFKGRKLWNRLNLWNSNPKAVEIAQRELASIANAVSKPHVARSEDLHDVPMGIRVAHRKMDDGEITEEVKGYCCEKDLPSKMKSNPTPTNPATSGTSAPTPPWSK